MFRDSVIKETLIPVDARPVFAYSFPPGAEMDSGNFARAVSSAQLTKQSRAIDKLWMDPPPHARHFFNAGRGEGHGIDSLLYLEEGHKKRCLVPFPQHPNQHYLFLPKPLFQTLLQFQTKPTTTKAERKQERKKERKKATMTITIHHLGISQSERILFLCEELALEYNLVHHIRDPLTSPQSLKSLEGNSTGKAPFIVDDGVSPTVTLSESAAICEYIIETYGSGKLSKKKGEVGFVEYTYWFNYIAGTLQPAMSTAMMVGISGLPQDNFLVGISKSSVKGMLELVDKRLGESKWFAGEEFTAADVMAMYSLSTGRYWSGVRVEGYANILRWLGDVAARPAYQRAMGKGDPEMRCLVDGWQPEKSLLALGGVKSDVWKKNT